MHTEIQEFIVSQCGITSSLPRVSRTMTLKTKEDPSKLLTDREREDISSYLVKTYPDLRDLRRSDVASDLHDTISFLVKRLADDQKGKLLGNIFKQFYKYYKLRVYLTNCFFIFP